MAATPHDSSGTTLTFPGFTGSVTSITYSRTEAETGATDRIDISHLGLTTGASILTQDRPLKGNAGETGKTVSVEFIGAGTLQGGASGTLTIAGGISISSSATVVSSSVTLAVNDVIRGNAEFRVA